MLSLPHAAVGIAIASVIPNPIISLPLALISHFIFDLYPHWNPNSQQFPLASTQLLIVSDFVLAMSFAFYVSFLHNSYFYLLAGLMGILPDLVEAPHYLLHLKIPGVKGLIKYQSQHQFHIKVLPGLITQLAILVVSFFLIFHPLFP